MKQHARLLIRHYQRLNDLDSVFDKARPALERISTKEGKFLVHDSLISDNIENPFLHGVIYPSNRKAESVKVGGGGSLQKNVKDEEEDSAGISVVSKQTRMPEQLKKFPAVSS